MRKSLKLLVFLMSGIGLFDTGCVYASGAGSGLGGDTDLIGSFPVTIGAARGRGGADIAEHTLGFLGTQKFVAPDGQILQLSKFKVAGAGMVVAAPDGVTPDLELRRMELSHASLGRYLPGDIRTPEEVNCDMSLLDAYKSLTELNRGLNDFATGQTAEDLTKLAKAIRRLEPSDEFMGRAIRLFSPLIGIVKAKGELLAVALSADIPSVLGVLNRAIEHCEAYIGSRMDIAEGVSLSKLSEVNSIDFDKLHVSLEKVNITDIHTMFHQVEKTLNSIMRRRLTQEFDPIKVFLGNVRELKHGGDGKPKPATISDHGRQIIDLSKMFKSDIGIVEFIDLKWISPDDDNFKAFKDGVKYINMLIESIRDYAQKVQQIANGAYLGALEGGLVPSTALALREPFEGALAVPGGADDEARKRELMKGMKGYAEGKMEVSILPDLQHKMELVERYIADNRS